MPPSILDSYYKKRRLRAPTGNIAQKHTLREMAYHYSNPLPPTSSLRSAAPAVDDLSSQLSHDLCIYETAHTETAVQGTQHVTERGAAACWSALRRPLPVNLRERVKTGLRAVRVAAGPHPRSGEKHTLNDRPEAAFSALGASVGMQGGARLFLAQMPPDAPPPTVVWASPQQQGQDVAWGQWPCHTFTHCITVLTERNARAMYELDDAPLPPVYACALDGVAHLWLFVPPRTRSAGARERLILSDEQMRAAVEFADAAGAGAGAEPENDAGRAGPMLLACAERNEVDVAALAVLLLARRSHPAGHEHAPFPDRHCRRRGERALAGCAPTYQAARLLDDDAGISLVWKGLLGWQDVERLQAVLWTCDRDFV
ncbi:hypothetical protein BJY52DRAFT_1293450 [Lactarius psammicola]|nr:hypothetical protein BJY52DRAFT_1293450 [Lactarius psammicola]